MFCHEPLLQSPNGGIDAFLLFLGVFFCYHIFFKFLTLNFRPLLACQNYFYCSFLFCNSRLNYLKFKSLTACTRFSLKLQVSLVPSKNGNLSSKFGNSSFSVKDQFAIHNFCFQSKGRFHLIFALTIVFTKSNPLRFFILSIW